MNNSFEIHEFWCLPIDQLRPRIMVDIYCQGALGGDESVEHFLDSPLELWSALARWYRFQFFDGPPESVKNQTLNSMFRQ